MSVLNNEDLSPFNDTWMNYGPRAEKHEPGDYTPFYVAITICSVIGGFLFILNIVFCWCSEHRHYWQDRHTGNRWIQSMWVVTPHKNPPLDLSELEPRAIIVTQYQDSSLYYPTPEVGEEEARFRESELGTPQPQEYMELHKRESDI